MGLALVCSFLFLDLSNRIGLRTEFSDAQLYFSWLSIPAFEGGARSIDMGEGSSGWNCGNFPRTKPNQGVFVPALSRGGANANGEEGEVKLLHFGAENKFGWRVILV